MNGRDRILTALGGGQADRVPLFIHAINEASIINIGRHFTDDLPEWQHVNLMPFEDQLKLLDALVLIHDELDVDGITSVPLETEEDIDETHYRNEWGVVMERNPHGLAVPVGHPIASLADLDSFKRPSAEDGMPLFVADMVKPRVEGRKAMFFFVEGPFTMAWYLRGLEPLMVDFIRNPDVVHRLIRMATDHALEMVDLAADAGMDAIIVEDDIADKHNPFVSSKYYATFVQPALAEIVARAHARGLKAVFHSDGNLWPILDQILAAGFDGLNPLEPEAGMDLEKVKQAYGDRICLLGNIECGWLLSSGTPAEVEAAVRHAIDVAAPGGGYILCESNSIHPGVDPVNFITMMRTAKACGVYA